LFYAMNDWRSTFGGVNDHEADWEMVTVYLAEREPEPPEPEWVAVSSHDHHGDDLRRRWDDPELVRQGTHPVVFVGAGSHSGAFVPGDYVTSVDPPALRPLLANVRRLKRLLAPWRDGAGAGAGFGIPFVDYLRGDGATVGPGGDAAWSCVPIDDETPWVRDYRGLWGLDTNDRFGGERAPSGPRYDRDGSVRTAWANPLGWAGLLKVAPGDGENTAPLSERVAALDFELAELDAQIARKRDTLRALRAQARSLDAHDHTRNLARQRSVEVREREAELNRVIAGRTRLAEERRAHLSTLSEPLRSEPAQAHLTRHQQPRSAAQQRRTRFLRAWAVVSTPLLLASIAVVLTAPPLASLTTVGVLVAAFSAVEAIAHRRFLSLLASVLLLGIIVALLVGFILVFRQHWRIAVAVAAGAAALGLLIGNLRDVRHHWAARRAAQGDEP
jgi:hypothetical protein